MSNKPFIIVDIDDTIINTTHYFDNWLRENHDFKGPLLYETQSTYTELGLWDKLLLFFQTKYYNQIPLKPYCEQILSTLAEFYNIIFISSCSTNKLIIGNREKFLTNSFLFKFTLHCLPLNSLKHSLIDKYKPIMIFEDNRINALYAYQTYNTIPFIFNISLYNNNNSPVPTYKNWREIRDAISKLKI